MKKLITILLTLSILFQSFLPGFILPVRIVYAGTLSTSMFPSSLLGRSLEKTRTQTYSPCWAEAEEYVQADYEPPGQDYLFGVTISKFASSGAVKKAVQNCLALDSGTQRTTKNITVSGYSSILIKESIPVEEYYSGTLYITVENYWVTVDISSYNRSISEETLKSAGAAIVALVPLVEKRADGEYCKESEECQGGRCYNNICCKTGHECCTEHGHCRETRYCDTSHYYCLDKKHKGKTCRENKECFSNYCGYASESDKKICCEKTETGLCCLAHNDCGSMNYCEDYSCWDKKSEGASCWKDYECSSGLCEEGKCKYKGPERKKKNDGESCTYHYECKSGNCGNEVCCQKDKNCCRSDDNCQYLSQFHKCQNYYCVEDKVAKEAHEKKEKEAEERYKKGHDGVCEPDEECTTQDCMATARCVIEEACSWGGDVRTAAGCIASIASELNIVAKVADIIQGIGCDVIVNFLAGIIEQNIDKVTDALAGIIYVAIDIVGLKLGTVIKLLIKIVQCIDGYFHISRNAIYFFYELLHAIVNVASAVAQRGAVAISLGSPASLMVIDRKGHSVGIDEQGNLHEDVPGGFYVEFPEADIKMVILTDTKGKDFTVETYGEKTAEIDVKIARCDKGEKEVIEYNDISQDAGTKTRVLFKGEVGEGLKGMTMEVTSAEGKAEYEAPDKVTTDKIEVPKKFMVRKFNLVKILLYILLAMGIALIAVGVYIFKFRRRK